ncbi:DNA-protecting protein DprA [Candidatus Dependentiae bacterium]|nr:MAG: DNA-protecting protein DprA [Candidatus Dependentiae bacterium]
MDQNTIVLHLSLINDFGPVSIAKLVDYCIRHTIALDNIYAFTINDFKLVGFSAEKSQFLVNELKQHQVLDKELALLEKSRLHYTTIVDKTYPSLLAKIYAPPAVLYYQGDGNAMINQCALAVVGSRACNSYGGQVITQLLPACIAQGITIVSGGALGIDTLAHQITVDHGGKTVVVLGSGLLRQYPSTNRRLFEKVVEKGGSIVSCFSLEMEAFPGNFPARNRIIAGLAQTTLVVQAAEKSGALITASYALEQGRNVAAVPGNIFDPLSVGCNNLIKQGAYLVENPIDILQLYDITINKNQLQNPDLLVETKSADMRLTDEQKQIIAFCKNNERTVDEIMAHVQLSSEKVSQELFNLECLGVIQNNFLHWKSV